VNAVAEHEEEGKVFVNDWNSDCIIAEASLNEGYEFDYWDGDIRASYSMVYFREGNDVVQYNIEAHFKKRDDNSYLKIGKLRVNTILLKVKQSDSIPDKELAQKAVDIAVEMLKALRVKTVTNKDESHDAELTVSILTAEALGDYYSDGNYYYSGACLEGKAVITAGNGKVLKADAEATIEPFESIIRYIGSPVNYKTPEEAPFAEALPNLFDDCLYAAFGPDVLIYNCDYINQGELVRLGKKAVPHLIDALDDPDVYVRLYAIDTLRQLDKNAMDAVPSLISILKDDSYEYFPGNYGDSMLFNTVTVPKFQEKRFNSIYKTWYANSYYEGWRSYIHDITAEVLSAITGKNFGRDAGAWETWYNTKR
jgi:hypothetical protein